MRYYIKKLLRCSCNSKIVVGTYVVVAIIAMLVFFGVQLLLNIIFKKYGLVVCLYITLIYAATSKSCWCR